MENIMNKQRIFKCAQIFQKKKVALNKKAKFTFVTSI